jgi:hypothetical protein
MLPPLRRDLDLMPSPVEAQPGILIRDPMRYSDAMIVVPWALAPCLDYFDGRHSELDLRELLVRITGELDVGGLLEQLLAALRDNAFLQDETFEAQRERQDRAFAEAATRRPSHAGSAYPAEAGALRETMRGYLDPAGGAPRSDGVVAIASPHVSPFGGWQSYRAAYGKLRPDAHERTFVVLGTSHYGEPEKFGLTRKPFETPLGSTRTDAAFVDRLASRAAPGVVEEDYCHAVEHSIEFQVLFLQWLYGPDITVVPILCGAFANSIYFGGKPEGREGVARFLGELGEIAAARDSELAWVLGVDMAHIGRRYGDSFTARADEGYLAEVATRDQARNERVTAGDADGFWDLIQKNRDDLRWCGSSPLYAFLKARPGLRGSVERYEQWNIDEASVVSFAGISFAAPVNPRE